MQHRLSTVNMTRSLYLWNLMIRDSINNGLFSETLSIYSSMVQSGVHGNSFTFPLVFKACTNINSIRDGKLLQAHVLQLGFHTDMFVQTALIDMYSKCFDLASSRKVFDKMPIRSVVSWNSMISAYSRSLQLNEAISLLKEMWVSGLEPNASTFVSVVSACTLRQGLSIHGCTFKLGLIMNYDEIPLSNSVMSMYVKFGQIDAARSIFDLMDERSIVSWATLINGYVTGGNVSEAISLFNNMRHTSLSLDLVVFVHLISGCAQVGNLLASSVHCLILKSGHNDKDPIDNLLVSMYVKCCDLSSARKVFDMVDKKSVFLWTSMISGSTQMGYPSEAVDLFKLLLRTTTKPSEATLAIILSACADLGSLSMGKEIEQYILQNKLESDRQLQTSLINMFCKCGSVKEAKEVFERVSNKDLAVWGAMINGYAIQGMGNEALSLFHKMQNVEGIKPDAVVYTSILLACTHSGLVDDGLRYFQSMQKDFGIEPSVEHYTCLVDLLSRAGQFDLALKIIQEMPVQVQAQAWAPLLSACRKYRNIGLGEFAARQLLDLNPKKTANYVLMANLYTSEGRWEEAAMTRSLIKDRGLVKEPGWSEVEIDGSVHSFVTGDRSHHHSVDICKIK